MPTDGDANFDLKRAILVSSLIEGLKVNFGQSIIEELFVRAYKTTSKLPFKSYY